jgi:XTP/dITP diphosphohydrolase
MPIDTLVIATRNKHKVEEIRAILAPLGVNVKDLTEFPNCPEVEETGTTLEENALLKARAAHACTGLPVIADDTGLEVYYLMGEPGVYSARYAGENATYADNCRKLLRTLLGVPSRRRQARFRTVVAFIAKGREELFDDKIEGRIGVAARGANGFGYDPIFVPEGSPKSYAELTLEEKNVISHRARAVGAFRDFLAREVGTR